MRSGNHTNALLIELAVVIFFFMIGAVIVMQVFGKSFELSHEAEAGTKALAEAQSIADELYAGAQMDEVLAELGFVEGGQETIEEGDAGPASDAEAAEDGSAMKAEESSRETWLLEKDVYTIRVELSREERPAGHMDKAGISAVRDGEELFTIPCIRYVGDTDE